MGAPIRFVSKTIAKSAEIDAPLIVNRVSHFSRLAFLEVSLELEYHVVIVLSFCAPHSETGPSEGTLRVFPDVLLSNAYILLRPFFRSTAALGSADLLDPNNWTFGTI
jgi:hypothetical protein